jgi:hypothetical protein
VISGGSGIGNVFCAPNCFCSIACMSPMTGNAGGVESGGASSIYCQPCGCATYCPFPGPMLPAQNMPGVSPVQGGASTGGVATMMPWRCGQGQERWRALSPGKADISAGWNGVCGGGVPCPPFARPMWVGFVVHVIVKQ